MHSSTVRNKSRQFKKNKTQKKQRGGKMPEINAPKMPEINAPKMPEINAPKMPEINAPKMLNHATTTTTTTTAPSLAYNLCVGVPLRMTDKVVDSIEGIAGIDSSVSPEEVKRQLAKKVGILSAVFKDPKIVNDVTITLREINKILIKTLNEDGPKIISAGSNLIQTIPPFGNIISAIRSAAEGTEAGVSMSKKLVDAGILSIDSLNRVKEGAKRMNQLSHVGKAIDAAGQGVANKGLRAATNAVSATIKTGLDVIDKDVQGKNIQRSAADLVQHGGNKPYTNKNTIRERIQSSIAMFMHPPQ